MNNGVISEIELPNGSQYSVKDRVSGYVDSTTNQVIGGQKDFTTTPRAYIEEIVEVPTGYKQYKFLESTGTQYINTNFTPTDGHKYRYIITLSDLTVKSNLNECTIFGSRINGGNRGPLLYYYKNARLTVNLAGYNSTMTPIKMEPMLINVGDLNTFDFTIDTVNHNASFSYNGNVLQNQVSYSGSINCGYPTFIFGNDASGTLLTNELPGGLRLYRLSLYIDDILAQDYVPASRDSDGVMGLYDIVNNAFFTNAGTGVFNVGKRVYPHYETLLTDAAIPTNISEFTNDVGYITAAYHDATKANQSAVDTINAKIPSAATSSNQLADKAFVNSSIETATATFKGTYNTIADIEALTADDNDYAFYRHTDAAGNTLFDRYKYDGTTWLYEYTLNNSSFTSDQWAALNSGVSAGAWVDMSTAQVISGQKDFDTVPRVKVTHQTHNLPSEYQEIEYIGSNGNQYINTSFVPTNNNYGFDIDLLVVDTPNTANGYIGYRSVSAAAIAGDMRYCFIYGDKRLAIRNGVSADNSTSTIALNQKYNFNYSSGSLKINGIEQVSCTQYSANPTFKTFYLFKANTDNYYSADLGTFIGQIYEAKLYNDGTLERDFIPCYRKTDDKPGMYDLITKTFFTNAGTGEFGVGPDIELITYESLLTDASFATVAKSGNYNDLINKPTIPTVYNATLTIQKNGTTINTFTANASSNKTINIIVPTNTNDLTNGAGFITSSDVSTIVTKQYILNLLTDADEEDF